MTAPTAPSDLFPEAASGAGLAPAPPFAQQTITLTRQEHIQLVSDVRYWRSQHERAVTRAQWTQKRHDQELAGARAREAALQAEIVDLKAQVRDLRQRVFGTRTEQSRFFNPAQFADSTTTKRRRGQQPGARGHGRRCQPHLTEQAEAVDLVDPSCPNCGQPLSPMPGAEHCEVIELEVRAYRRSIRRRRWRSTCRCGCLPGIVSAPPPPRLIPRGKLGVSVWVHALLTKFLYGQPTHRLLQDWREQGLHVAQGTLTGGLRRLAPLFAVLAQAGRERLRTHSHWHADETRWEVFVQREGKVGHRWYLWVFQAEDVVHYVLDPSRSAKVPDAVLDGVADGILSVDRYAAYKKFATDRCNTDHGAIELAYCWAHQRRDFLKVANDHPALWGWAMAWAERIGQLYRLHAARRAAFEGAHTSLPERDHAVRQAVQAMGDSCTQQLADTTLATPARKALQNLQIYWSGLTVFVDHPWLDLDNNAAERALRPAVVARKNFYGSGSEWSGALAADLLSVLMTARLWELNVRLWLHEYLQACAEAGGHVPADIAPFVPWRMQPGRLAQLRRFDPPCGPARSVAVGIDSS